MSGKPYHKKAINLRETFKTVYRGPIGGDCCSTNIFEPIINVTVQQLLDYIINVSNEWGYITVGNIEVEYAHGKYVDENRKEINYTWPPHILNMLIKQVIWSGGWSRGDWEIKI